MQVRRRAIVGRSRAAAAAVLCLLVLAPTPALAALGYALQVSDTSVQVGDTLTITPVVTDPPAGMVIRCSMTIGRETSIDDWMRMQVSSNGCEPWSFTVPATLPGLLLVQGVVHVLTQEGAVDTFAFASDQSVEVEVGGTPAPFVTNYPVQSWALPDIVSDVTPTHGAPLTIKPPAAAESCNLRIVADYEESAVSLVDACEPWTLAIPDREPLGPADLLEDRTEITVRGWIGASVANPAFPPYSFNGTMYGETFTANLPEFEAGSGSGSGYASNHPAVFVGPQRGFVGQVDAAQPLQLEPVVIGATAGWCSYAGGAVVPVVEGGCEEPYPIGPLEGSAHGTVSGAVLLLDEDITIVSDAFVDVGWVLDMSDVVLGMPSTADSGELVTINAANDEGVPAGYDVLATTEAGPGGVAPASTVTIASGTFQPSLGSHGETLHLTHAFSPGTWTVTATFTDVKGDTQSDSSVIEVADVTPPVGSVSINAGATWSTSTGVSVAVPATDAGGTVATVALSNDGVSWTNRAYATPQPWILPATNGTSRMVLVKWQDADGNWSLVENDTIGLDTVAPIATAPKHAYLAGATVKGGAIPVQLTWSGSDATSGIARYEAAISTNGGAFATFSTSLVGGSAVRNLLPGRTYQVRVRPVDGAGNVGTWVTGAMFSVQSFQDGSASIVRTGTWSTASSTSHWGGTERFATAAGASARITFTGRSFAWIGSVGPSRGTARVYVNGALVKTISLQASSTAYRRVLVSLTYTTSASRTIKVVVSGTAGHPRVNVDAFVTGT